MAVNAVALGEFLDVLWERNATSRTPPPTGSGRTTPDEIGRI
jgi:hypothetical protein